ncbi:protein CgeA [Bacillus sp. IB182487]|uniref:Protein CgeA n=2 Tax=Metabacillus arenae TaxID=2771434 RepID=A0A926NCU8_9BACI|nr:protein CgeA [Metabacillus arenae]
MYDMVVFKSFDCKTCAVTVIDEDVSPPENSIIKIDCEKIESVSFTSKP